MYPSMVIIPVAQVAFAVFKRIAGPMKTIRMSHRIAEGILDVLERRPAGMSPENMKFELGLIERWMPRPWIACLETACAFELWLSFHGESCQICLGRRVINGDLYMHAWVETNAESFFFMPGFEKLEWKMM